MGERIPQGENNPGIIERAKEVFSLAGYVPLKLKEYLGGQLSQEEFDRLLAFDFKIQAWNNSGIEGVFSPEEELQYIRTLGKEQKRQALDEFKEKLAAQREALARCRVFIERSIEFNHDVPREKLIAIIEAFGSKYGFTDDQKAVSVQLLDAYYVNRKKVLEMREHFPDNRDLIHELTGLNFDDISQFDVSVGPMSIDITCPRVDVAKIGKEFKGPQGPLTHPAFAVKSKKDDIMITLISKEVFRPGILVHEHEHQKNKLFEALFAHYVRGADKQEDSMERDPAISQRQAYKMYAREQDAELKQTLLESYLGLIQKMALEYAKDEIIAMKKDKMAYNYEYKFRQDGSYDYASHVRTSKTDRDNAAYQRTSKEILIDEYQAIVKRAVEAFDALVEKGGYTTEEVIAMLSDKLLPEWPKTARRLLEQR